MKLLIKKVNPNYPFYGALWMIIEGVDFAIINVITPFLGGHYPSLTSNWVAFYQYLFALIMVGSLVIISYFEQVDHL